MIAPRLFGHLSLPFVGTKTTGVVTSVEYPRYKHSNHVFFSYEFRDSTGKQFHSLGDGGVLLVGRLVEAEKVNIIYDATDPRINSLVSQQWNVFLWPLLLSVALLLYVAFGKK